MKYATSHVDTSQTRRSCENWLEMFTHAFLHRAQPKTRSSEWGFRFYLERDDPRL